MEAIVHHSTIPYTDTMFEGVKRVPPGHFMSITPEGRSTIERYWKPETIKIDYSISEDEAVTKFKQLFDQAISELIDDLSVTACELSGGLDSSSILSWIKHQHPGNKITAFSMTFDSLEKCNETAYINLINDQYDINLVKLPTDTLDYKHRLNLDYNYKLNPHWPIFITYTMGFPLVKTAKAMGVKTVLTGQGGDHLMSGNFFCLHDYFKQFRWKALYTELMTSKKPFQLIKRFILLPLLAEKNLNLFVFITHPFRKKWKPAAKRRQLPFREYSDFYTGNSLAFKYDLSQVVHSVRSALYENSYYHVAESVFGVEFRHPFFDRRLVEFMLSLPPRYKLYKGRSKFLLRKAMKGILPEKIRRRTDKARFSDVIRQQINAIDLDLLLDDAYIAKMGIIEQSRINEMKSRYQDDNQKNIVYFWQIINLEYWYRYNFINSPVPETDENS